MYRGSLVIAQIDRIDDFRQKRQNIAKKYLEELKNIKEIEFLDFDFDEVLPHIFVIKTKKRDELREYLINNNIECGIHYKPNHLHTKYKSDLRLPITDQIYEKILTLPCHFDLTNEEQNIVINKIKAFHNCSLCFGFFLFLLIITLVFKSISLWQFFKMF